MNPDPDNSLCLYACRFGRELDSVFLGSCLILGLFLLECNLDLIKDLGNFKVLITYKCEYTLVYVKNFLN